MRQAETMNIDEQMYKCMDNAINSISSIELDYKSHVIDSETAMNLISEILTGYKEIEQRIYEVDQ